MPQDNPPLLDKTMNTTESTPRNLADVLASGLANIATNVKPDGSDISIDVAGMSANNVNDGFSELKQSLDDKNNVIFSDAIADEEITHGVYTQLKSVAVEAGLYLVFGYHEWTSSTANKYNDYIGTTGMVFRNLSCENGGGFGASTIVKMTTSGNTIYGTYLSGNTNNTTKGTRMTVIKL